MGLFTPKLKASQREFLQATLEQTQDAIDHVNTATDPLEFFFYFHVTLDLILRLIPYEKYKKFTGPSPTEEYNRILANLEDTVNSFIDRNIVADPHNTKHLIDLYFDRAQTFWPGQEEFPHYSGPLFTSANSARVRQIAASEAKINDIAYKLTKYSSECLFPAIDVILETKQASVSIIQRRLSLSYTESAKLISKIEDIGLISQYVSPHPRTILVSPDEWTIIKARLADSLNSKVSTVSDNISYANDLDSELQAIDQMEGHAFEHWCAKLLTDLGYTNVEVTQASGDHGVDVLAQKDGLRYAIQCKCYSSDLGNSPVQEVATGKLIYNCHVGAVMTNRYFTSGAKVAADATLVLLWDRDWIKNAISERNSKASPKE